MKYIGIFQIMEPRNLVKPNFETSVMFESLGIFWCGFIYETLSTLKFPLTYNGKSENCYLTAGI